MASMALTPEQAETQARNLHEQDQAERGRLDDVRRYWKGRQRLPVVLPSTAPTEVRTLARMARVNVIDLVVESLAQSLAVEGYRAGGSDDEAVWDVWQANKLDARQSIIHRACLAYGIAYAVVTPGTPVPVIRGLSPRRLTTLYDDGAPDWPAYALERDPGKGPWRLYDDTSVYLLTFDGTASFKHQETREHDAGVTPVVRYLEVQDPDWDDEPSDESFGSISSYHDRHVIGQVASLMSIQDQVDLITFNLLVAQHFTAFQQRYVIGWLAPDEQTKLKMSGSTIWTFDDQDVQVGVLQGAPLDGYLTSRESSFKQVASLSQTPAHELIGELVNLSAEALAAAEAGRDRKVADRQTTIGEAHEQTLALAARLAGMDVPDDAQVVWRDTSARSFAATVDGLVKLVQVGVPLSEVLALVPGLSQQDIERIKAARPVTAPVPPTNGTGTQASSPPATGAPMIRA